MSDKRPFRKSGGAIKRAADYAFAKGKNPRAVFDEVRGHLAKLGGEEKFKSTLEKWSKALRLNR